MPFTRRRRPAATATTPPIPAMIGHPKFQGCQLRQSRQIRPGSSQLQQPPAAKEDTAATAGTERRIFFMRLLLTYCYTDMARETATPSMTIPALMVQATRARDSPLLNALSTRPSIFAMNDESTTDTTRIVSMTDADALLKFLYQLERSRLKFFQVHGLPGNNLLHVRCIAGLALVILILTEIVFHLGNLRETRRHSASVGTSPPGVPQYCCS